MRCNIQDKESNICVSVSNPLFFQIQTGTRRRSENFSSNRGILTNVTQYATLELGKNMSLGKKMALDKKITLRESLTSDKKRTPDKILAYEKTTNKKQPVAGKYTFMHQLTLN